MNARISGVTILIFTVTALIGGCKIVPPTTPEPSIQPPSENATHTKPILIEYIKDGLMLRVCVFVPASYTGELFFSNSLKNGELRRVEDEIFSRGYTRAQNIKPKDLENEFEIRLEDFMSPLGVVRIKNAEKDAPTHVFPPAKSDDRMNRVVNALDVIDASISSEE